jgi:hypothetical protein
VESVRKEMNLEKERILQNLTILHNEEKLKLQEKIRLMQKEIIPIKVNVPKYSQPLTTSGSSSDENESTANQSTCKGKAHVQKFQSINPVTSASILKHNVNKKFNPVIITPEKVKEMCESKRKAAEKRFQQRLEEYNITLNRNLNYHVDHDLIAAESVRRREYMKQQNKKFFIYRKRITQTIESIFNRKVKGIENNNTGGHTPSTSGNVHRKNQNDHRTLIYDDSTRNFRENLDKLLQKKLSQEQIEPPKESDKPKKKVLFDLDEVKNVKNEDDSDFNIISLEEEVVEEKNVGNS